jgi:hypothetical protein
MSSAGLSANLTLLQALNLGGGGCLMLARQGTAALLNSCALSGHYTYKTAQVISMVHNAIASGNCGTTGNLLGAANEVQPDNCPSAGRATKRLAFSDMNVTVYPNPFSNKATMEITSDADYSNVSVEVFDVDGKKVMDVFHGDVNAYQTYDWTLDGAQLARGIYYYRIVVGVDVLNGKIILVN